jgi:hypothetical protein
MATARARSRTRQRGNGNKGNTLAEARHDQVDRRFGLVARHRGRLTRTINVTSSTVITKGGQMGAIDALRSDRFPQPDAQCRRDVHDQRHRRPDPRRRRRGTAVDATTITVKARAATRHHRQRGDRLQARFGCGRRPTWVGVRVAARGRQRVYVHGDHGWDHDPSLIARVTGDLITVKRGDGSTVIHVTPKTMRAPRARMPPLAEAAVGDRVSAEGTLRPDGPSTRPGSKARPRRSRRRRRPRSSSP